MLNFVELRSHLGDPPSEETRNPFTKYRAAFKRVYSLFDGVLPSAESGLMHGVGLTKYTGKMWIVDGASVGYQVKVIAHADSLENVRAPPSSPRVDDPVGLAPNQFESNCLVVQTRGCLVSL
jgi:hypothetical protein